MLPPTFAVAEGEAMMEGRESGGGKMSILLGDSGLIGLVDDGTKYGLSSGSGIVLLLGVGFEAGMGSRVGCVVEL